MLLRMKGRTLLLRYEALLAFSISWLVWFVPSAAVAQPGENGTGYITRDTLVQTMYLLHHKPLQVGLEGSFTWGWYSGANFPEWLAPKGCDFYSTGSWNGFSSLRTFADMPLWGDASPFSVKPSLFWNLHRPDFQWFLPIKRYNSQTNTLGPDSIRYEIATTLDEVGFGGSFEYQAANNFRFEAGLDLGILFLQHYVNSVSHAEAGPLLESGKLDTILSTGKLFNHLAVFPTLSIGASYEVPLSRTLHARPGISFSIPFGGDAATSPSWLGSMSYWHAVELHANLALLFDLTPRTEAYPVFVKREIRVPAPPPVLPPPAPKLNASIRAVAVSRSGVESNVVRMTVEEVRTRNADPILNYIFFDPGSDKFPSRYVTYASAEAAEQEFQGSTDRHDISLMALYRETLNIIGDRLRKYPEAKLILTGTTDNTDDKTANVHEVRTTKALLALAHARAEAVKNYLVNIWKIEPTRLKVEAMLLPGKPSPVSNEAGRAEDRRVEMRLVSNSAVNLHVLDPVIVTNIEHLATPDQIRLIPTVSESDILRTFAAISAGGVELQTFSTTATSQQEEKVWAPTEAILKKLRDSLEIDYDVWDSTGNHAHAHSSIPLDVIHIKGNRPERIERFSLILFGFDEASLNSNNERSIRSAAEMIPKIPVRRVLIQGYTDETGEPVHNDELSTARADAVRDRLDQMLQSEGATIPSDIHIEGHGSRDILYDNSLPEGRFFSRTVNITIEREP